MSSSLFQCQLGARHSGPAATNIVLTPASNFVRRASEPSPWMLIGLCKRPEPQKGLPVGLEVISAISQVWSNTPPLNNDLEALLAKDRLETSFGL
jgi:hypothetical protein